MTKKSLKIISMPVDNGGCGNYRVRQPFEMIQRFTNHDTHIINPQKDDMVEVAKAVQVADVIVARPGAGEGMHKFLSQPEYKGKKWILDIDDNTEDISPYNFHYKEYGVEEYFDKNQGEWLWKDGQGEFDLEANQHRWKWLKWSLENATAISVTTQKLAEYARQYNENVFVLPNCINFERWWPLDLKPNKILRVGWSGGVSHYEDWYSIKEPLNKLMAEFDFTLVTVGSDFKGVVDRKFHHRVESHDWVPFKGHSYRMMAMALDVAVIPLADLPFNHYKSSIKWYEMSAMGVPSVVANILPYSADITPGETALGYNGSDEFYNALRTALTKPGIRKEIASNAQQWVKKHRDAKTEVGRWVQAYRQLT